MVARCEKILTHTAFWFILLLILALTGCQDKDNIAKDNTAKAVVAPSSYTTLDKFYKEHNVSLDILKDPIYAEFNAGADTTLKLFTGTPYYKYVEEVVLNWAGVDGGADDQDIPDPSDPSKFDNLTRALYYGTEFGIDYGALIENFRHYSKSFLKDYPFFSFKMYKDVTDQFGYQTSHFNYLEQYDKENNTKFTEFLPFDSQITMEILVKTNANSKFEKIIKDILKVQSDTTTIDRRGDIKTLIKLGDVFELMICAEAEYKSDYRKSCYAELSELVIYSNTFRKSNPDLFKGLPTPEELVNIYNKSKTGNATENELKALNYSPDDSTISIITHRLDNMLNPPPSK